MAFYIPVHRSDFEQADEINFCIYAFVYYTCLALTC